MSKTLISSIVVVALIVVGGYFIIKGNKDEATQPIVNPVVNTETNNESTGKKMAFSEFVKQGGSYKCEVKQYMSDMENSGTVYLDKGRISGEYETIAEGMTMKSNFVMKDGYSYNWSNVMPNMGYKVKVNVETEATSGDASGTYAWKSEQIGDYDCQPWTIDEAKFNLPANITFTTIE